MASALVGYASGLGRSRSPGSDRLPSAMGSSPPPERSPSPPIQLSWHLTPICGAFKRANGPRTMTDYCGSVLTRELGAYNLGPCHPLSCGRKRAFERTVGGSLLVDRARAWPGGRGCRCLKMLP